MITITCSKCGNSIEVSKALEDEMRGSIEQQIRVEADKKIEQSRREIEEKVASKLREQYELDVKNKIEELAENRKQNHEFRDQLLEMTKRLREEKLKAENMELSMRKELLESQEKIFNEAKSKAEEEHKIKIAELTKQLSDVAKVNDELRRKIEQKSQQLQGETLELDVEEILKRSFVYDTIEPVGKGVRGADIRQVVKTQMGNNCGVILWESKQTRLWSNEWIPKLKNDMRAEQAHIPIIVTIQLPDEAKGGFGIKDGVYIVSPTLMIPVADVLRQKLIELAREKYISQNRGTKADDLYTYITGHEFRQQVEALVETYQDMSMEITKEKVAFEKIWKTREAQLTKMFSSTARLVGSMRGIIGPTLPTVKGLELSEAHSEDRVQNDRQKLI